MGGLGQTKAWVFGRVDGGARICHLLDVIAEDVQVSGRIIVWRR